MVIARRGLVFFEKIPKNYKNFLEKIEESLQCELGRVLELTNGRKSGTAGKEKSYLYNLWGVLEIAVLTALFPEAQKLSRSSSPLKRVFVSEEMSLLTVT